MEGNVQQISAPFHGMWFLIAFLEAMQACLHTYKLSLNRRNEAPVSDFFALRTPAGNIAKVCGLSFYKKTLGINRHLLQEWSIFALNSEFNFKALFKTGNLLYCHTAKPVYPELQSLNNSNAHSKYCTPNGWDSERIHITSHFSWTRF